LLFSEAGLHWYPEEKCLHLRYALGAAGAKYSKQPGNKTRNWLFSRTIIRGDENQILHAIQADGISLTPRRIQC